ncbi:acyl carrier protein [Cyclobacterium sp. SYSU L10401]|uniref:acyl carrier protein n=1 Tax=Cyclobacterium sp. SYSU L10401 TaxID=2678657 RepID=UPI0013D1D097|nr:acyl carrier protein [Cyclobacterium sp. SYSU L10401]
MEKKFLALIKEALEMEDREPQLSDQFKEYDEWDSLSRLTLIAELDDQFDVTIASEEIEAMDTLQELLDKIKANQS